MSASDENGDLPPLTVATRAAGLLVAEGASLGLCAWAAFAGPALISYATTDTLLPPQQSLLVGAMGTGAGLAVILAAIILFWRRGGGVDLLSRIARRSAPLCVAGVVPFLFDWRLWVGRDLNFLVLAVVFGLSLQWLMRVALGTPPVLDLDFSSSGPRQRSFAFVRWRHLPLVITCLAGALCAAHFAYYTTISHYNLHTSAYDLGIEANMVWHAAYLKEFFRSSPLGGQMNLLGLHHSYFAYVMAPVFRLFPRPETLLVLQSIFMGASAVPLFLIARRRVGPSVACLVSCLLVLYPPFHGAVLYDFHYQPLSTFFLLMSLHLLEVRRNWWAALVILLTLSLREDIASLLAIIGLYLVLTGKRPRAGLVVAAVSAACFVFQKLIWMPKLFGGTEIFINQYEGLLPTGERGFAGVLKTVAGNPGFTIYNLLEQDKVTYLLKIFAPLALLPWRRPIGLLLFLPGFFFTLLATKYPALTSISFQYTAYWTPFVFIAAVDALAWLRGTEAGPRVPKTCLPAWLVAATASMLVCSYQHGAIFQHHTSGSAYDTFVFGKNPTDSKRHADLYALIAQIPKAASVLASEHVVPHVCSRPDAFSLRLGPFRGDYILVGFPITDTEKASVRDLVVPGKYGVVDVRGDFVLVKEGYPTTKNETLLERMRN
jgi:uncharacterized membrane protein